MKPKNFGKRPRKHSFSPPKAKRGGFKGAINKEAEIPLTGMVQNLKAAKGEERLSRTVYKAMNKGLVTDFKFRYSPHTTCSYEVGLRSFAIAHSMAASSLKPIQLRAN